MRTLYLRVHDFVDEVLLNANLAIRVEKAWNFKEIKQAFFELKDRFPITRIHQVSK